MDTNILIVAIIAGNAVMMIGVALAVHFMVKASQAQNRLIVELTKALLQVIIKEDKR